jgi:hypothetical protein
MSQLGRISGPLLDANLNRLGVDLTFRNYSASDDLLYLDVTNNRIGINKQPASRRFEINGTTHTPNLISTTSADIATITAATNTFSTDISSTIVIRPNQTNPLVTFDNMQAGDLDFKDNVVRNYASANGGIELNPNGTGIVDIYANTTVNGNITVTGNAQINGNLTEASNIIVGDSPLDTVIIAPDFTQSIIPGDHLTYDLGTSLKRWRQVHVHQNLDITSLTFNDVTVGLQLEIESGLPSIRTLQSNDDVILNSDTGNINIERIRFNGDNITNLDATAFTLASTGIGYVRFVDNNGLVIPSGTDAQRPASSEVGDTRWNTDNPTDNYLECFDGTTWNIATGAGGTISAVENYDLANAYILILG